MNRRIKFLSIVLIFCFMFSLVAYAAVNEKQKLLIAEEKEDSVLLPEGAI